MSFDLDAALRWLEPQRRKSPLRRRPDDELPWVASLAAVGAPILLDTTVYIDTLQGRSPEALDGLISLRTCHHSTVCLAELTHAWGRLSPADPRSLRTRAVIKTVIGAIPAHRLHAPDAKIWGVGGILAGLLFRLGSYPRGTERKCLNDALLYLQGRKFGWPIVTGNVTDFDYLNQLLPDGRIFLYRRVGAHG